MKNFRLVDKTKHYFKIVTSNISDVSSLIFNQVSNIIIDAIFKLTKKFNSNIKIENIIELESKAIKYEKKISMPFNLNIDTLFNKRSKIQNSNILIDIGIKCDRTKQIKKIPTMVFASNLNIRADFVNPELRPLGDFQNLNLGDMDNLTLLECDRK